MKNIKKYIVGALLAALMVTPQFSCKKYLQLNPISSFGPNFVFSSVSSATTAVLGAYNSLTGDAGFGLKLSMYYTYDDDNIMGAGATPFPDNDRRDIAHYTVQAGNAELAAPFNQLYTGVERANQCIYYIPKMSLYTSGDSITKQTLRQLYGESLTLRAEFYLELIVNWGDVPAQFAPSFAQPTLFIANTDRDTIYNHLLSDLQIAEQLVPWKATSGLTADRITQEAVRALRAKIALFRAGWSLRSNGAMQQGSSPQTYYNIAMNECDTIINYAPGIRLDGSYRAIFKNYICGHQQDPSGEIIWDVAMGGGNGTSDSKFSYYDGPKSENLGNASLSPLPTYFYLFDSTDTRRDVTICAYDIADNMGTLSPQGAGALDDGKFRRDWISPNVVASTAQYFGLDWPLIRFSDVLLMYAEASNEVNGGATGLALSRFMMVSQRAHGGNTIPTPSSAHDAFFSAIVDERAREFGGEGIRKYDLIRWNLLATNITNTKNNLTAISGTAGSYGQYSNYAKELYVPNPLIDSISFLNSPYQPESSSAAPAGYQTIGWVGTGNINTKLIKYYAVGFVANHSELLPFPTAAMQANPNLRQNPGY